MAILPPASSALSLLKSGGSQLFQNTVKQKPNDTLNTVLNTMSPEKAEDLRQKQQEARNVLEQLESSKKDMNEQRKAAAAEKIQQIKQKLQMLRLMAAMNPEAAARQAARLSRELAQAAKEYANAGGSSASMPTASSTGVPADTNAKNDAESAAVVPNQHQENGEMPADESVAAVVQTTFINPETVKQEIENIADDKEDHEKTFTDKINEQISASEKDMAKSRADSDFANEVKNIRNSLKQIIENAKRKMETEQDPSLDQDVKSAENALRQVDQAVNDINVNATAHMVAAPVTLNIQV